jgi:hypothetical protein
MNACHNAPKREPRSWSGRSLMMCLSIATVIVTVISCAVRDLT